MSAKNRKDVAMDRIKDAEGRLVLLAMASKRDTRPITDKVQEIAEAAGRLREMAHKWGDDGDEGDGNNDAPAPSKSEQRRKEQQKG